MSNLLSHRKSIELVIFFMHFGCLISSWKEFKMMAIGHCFVLMSLQVWQIAGVKILKSFTPDMKERYTKISFGKTLVTLYVLISS